MTSITLLSVVDDPALRALQKGAQPERAILVPGSKWQQGDVARLLDGAGQPPLMRGADTGQAAGNNLAPLGDELLQQPHIAVVDGVDLLHAELADLLAPEELASARAAGSTRTTRSTSPWATPAGATRGTVWTIACGTIRPVPYGTVWSISEGTFGRGAFGARCCCCCAGLFSHGFLFFLPARLFVFSRRDRPCDKQDRLHWCGGTWPALLGDGRADRLSAGRGFRGGRRFGFRSRRRSGWLRTQLLARCADRLDLVRALLFLVRAHGDELDHRLSHAKTALHLGNQIAFCLNDQQDVIAVIELAYHVGQLAPAQLLGRLQNATTVGDGLLQSRDQLVDIRLFHIRAHDEHHFIATLHAFLSS